MGKLNKHLKTVRTHRKCVRKMCFKMGIPWQGLTHDLSKYSPKELSISEYYTGTKSPHEVCRDKLGYSPSWMHHYHRNKHHWQYWLDMEDWPNKVVPVKMPYKYVIEMFCDFVGAGKAYMGDNWTKDAPWNYWMDKCEGKRLMDSESEYLLKKLLWNLKEQGMDNFIKWYKGCYKTYLIPMYNEGKLRAHDGGIMIMSEEGYNY